MSTSVIFSIAAYENNVKPNQSPVHYNHFVSKYVLLRQLYSKKVIKFAELLIFKQLCIFIALILILCRLDFEVIDAHSGLFSIMYELHDAENDNIILDSGSVSVKEVAVSSH